MSQERLNVLVTLFIEKHKLHEINFDAIIDDFGSKSVRKKLRYDHYC